MLFHIIIAEESSEFGELRTRILMKPINKDQ